MTEKYNPDDDYFSDESKTRRLKESTIKLLSGSDIYLKEIAKKGIETVIRERFFFKEDKKLGEQIIKEIKDAVLENSEKARMLDAEHKETEAEIKYPDSNEDDGKNKKRSGPVQKPDNYPEKTFLERVAPWLAPTRYYNEEEKEAIKKYQEMQRAEEEKPENVRKRKEEEQKNLLKETKEQVRDLEALVKQVSNQKKIGWMVGDGVPVKPKKPSYSENIKDWEEYQKNLIEYSKKVYAFKVEGPANSFLQVMGSFFSTAPAADLALDATEKVAKVLDKGATLAFNAIDNMQEEGNPSGRFQQGKDLRGFLDQKFGEEQTEKQTWFLGSKLGDQVVFAYQQAEDAGINTTLLESYINNLPKNTDLKDVVSKLEDMKAQEKRLNKK